MDLQKAMQVIKDAKSGKRVDPQQLEAARVAVREFRTARGNAVRQNTANNQRARR